MPIKRLTNQKAEFPEIGQLRKGAPRESNRPGKDLTYFRFTSDIEEVREAFESAYDGEPRLINVFLPFATPDENFEAWQEEYTAGSIIHRCDGETANLWLDKDGKYSTEPKPCPYESGDKQRTKKQPGCKPVGRLKVIIPELKRLAYVTALTTSIHDIRNIDAQLRALAGLRPDKDLRGIPLQLRRRPKKIPTPGQNGKRVRREKWLLSIEAAPSWVSLQLAAQEEDARPRPLYSGHEEDTAKDDVVEVDPETGEVLNWDADTFAAGEDAEEYADFVAAEVEQEEAEEAPEDIPDDVPTKPKALFVAVNNETAGAYNSILALHDAIQIELGDEGWEWPTNGSRSEWYRAMQAAISHVTKQTA